LERRVSSVTEYSVVKRIDLAIAGAGFAGLSCARAAASLGLKTAVLERKATPGGSLRTTGILVNEVVEEWEIPWRLRRRIPGVRLYSPSLRSADLVSGSYSFFATDTAGLLEWLATQAETAGAAILCRREYRTACRSDGAIRLQGLDLEARYLVGSDGALSRVSRDFGLGRNRRFLLGVEVEYQGVRGLDQDRLHCFLDPRLARGYLAWVVPGLGITQVGLASVLPARPRLDLFDRRVRKLFDFSGAREVGRRAGLIPVGGPVSPSGSPGVLLLGDAAGHVSPLSAGGIHASLRLGRLAGRAIAGHLLAGEPEPGSVLQGLVPSYTRKRLLRGILERAAPGWALDLLLTSPVLLALARLVFFHQRGLFSPGAWRELIGARGKDASRSASAGRG
jgi:digeranylgeranylglycerophospholipid reductase